MNLLVTGASGFIGSAFVRHVLEHAPDAFRRLTLLVRDSRQQNLRRLDDIPGLAAHEKAGKVAVVKGDLTGDISGVCEHHDLVIHFAAKTFVDHSIKDPGNFVRNNVVGTFNLLEDARRYKVKKLLNVGTDEVYGSIESGEFTEESPLNPRNPYAASKAGADALVMSYATTYGLNTLVTRTENNYGFYQHPQKALPVWIGNALRDRPIPIFGDGSHARQWLWVGDHAAALLQLLLADTAPGEVVNVAGGQEMTNSQMVRAILALTGRPESLVVHLDDKIERPGHDKRYALDARKLHRLIRWQPKVKLEDGLAALVQWHRDHPEWF